MLFHPRISTRFLSLIILSLLLAACTATGPQPEGHAIAKSAEVTAQTERDRIYTLLAYAVVLKDWQEANAGEPRGHNIGSVLVDSEGKVVFWARNSNKITGNGTQHGEVRLIRNYLHQVKTYNLKEHTVYTTLEPCAMCSGMMVLTSIKRTVYGQTDPGFGKALERLSLDSSHLHPGYNPYPRKVASEAADCDIRRQLDAAYEKYAQGGGRGITRWLRSEEAQAIYQEAWNRFMSMQVAFPENQPILAQARDFLVSVTDHYQPLPQ